MPSLRLRRLIPLVALLGLAALLPAQTIGARTADDTVTISGRAYAFNHMDTFLAGATIRVREFPKLSATTDVNGDYVLEVPGNANVTPYIEPPDGYHQIDLQTFHTRGEDIPNANFQTPGDLEYNGLAAILGVPLGPDGRPEQCVIVTTASARNVRGVDYDTFEERTPHGVPGATGRTYPLVPGPTYFNASVIPDSTKTETSEDGGMIWTEVPAGTYRVVTKSPSARFASFLATCEPGRIVNANPPWGAYELKGKEKPLGASIVAASVGKVTIPSNGKSIKFAITTGEQVDVKAVVTTGGDNSVTRKLKLKKPGTATVSIPVRDRLVGGSGATLRVKLEDAAGDRVRSTNRIVSASRSGGAR
jgi:hypothetical protein